MRLNQLNETYIDLLESKVNILEKLVIHINANYELQGKIIQLMNENKKLMSYINESKSDGLKFKTEPIGLRLNPM